MKIRVTSVSTTEVNEVISEITLALEDKIAPFFVDKYYGGEIEQFAIVIISSFNEEQNEGYSKAHNCFASYKDFVTKHKVKYFSIGLTYSNNGLLDVDPKLLEQKFCNSIIEKLDKRSSRIPSKFNYSEFSEDMKSVIHRIIKE